MLAKTPCMFTASISSICKRCSARSSPQSSRTLRLSTSAVSSASPSFGQTNANLNRKHNVAVEDEVVDSSEDSSSKNFSGNIRTESQSVQDREKVKLLAKRLKIRGIVEKAEDLLECRLNRRSNTRLISSLTSASSLINANGITSLLGDESKVFLPSIQKLEGSEHPLLAYVRGKSFEDSDILTSSFQLRSMIVLLVAKAFGVSASVERKSGVLDSINEKQKALAEITELIHAAHILHKTVVEIPASQFPALGKVHETSSSDPPPGIGASLHQGNKVATLMGDFLLAKSSKELSHLEVARVTVGMSESIADFTESEVIVCGINEELDQLNPETKSNVVTSDSDQLNSNLSQVLNYDKWLKRSKLSMGSLLGHACFGSVLFGGHEEEITNIASSIGTKIGLALQAYKDCSLFQNDGISTYSFDLCMLPVIYFLENNSHRLIPNGIQMFEEVKSDSHSAMKSKETLSVLVEDAQTSLLQLNPSPSSKLLIEFLKSLAP